MRPPAFSILADAMNPTEQKKAIMKTFFRVSSKWNSTTSEEYRMRDNTAKRRPPTTAAGMQNRRRVSDLFTRYNPTTSITAATAADWNMSKVTASIYG